MDPKNARHTADEDEYDRLAQYEKLADLFLEPSNEEDDDEDSEDYLSEPEELEE